MDVALIEHAQHDIDGEKRRQDQHRLVLSDCWKTCAVPWNLPWIVAGTPSCAHRVVDRDGRIARATRPARG